MEDELEMGLDNHNTYTHTHTHLERTLVDKICCEEGSAMANSN